MTGFARISPEIKSLRGYSPDPAAIRQALSAPDPPPLVPGSAEESLVKRLIPHVVHAVHNAEA